ncbi:hypothetical protein CONLIGDRAFT_165493 [Coniochaeta ligniaria NRRL 30616]|uniref:Uncharacterized protein n=1 Tax=Coniochaeta ligniaria NRRL 30616 TaxID=1408157 RepID=A0A1J7J1I5_9PEZI|nr:hypothetical protein CONLIGDRAFT_165493 [Coniochaeta ligniaria NRRL 30616]
MKRGANSHRFAMFEPWRITGDTDCLSEVQEAGPRGSDCPLIGQEEVLTPQCQGPGGSRSPEQPEATSPSIPNGQCFGRICNKFPRIHSRIPCGRIMDLNPKSPVSLVAATTHGACYTPSWLYGCRAYSTLGSGCTLSAVADRLYVDVCTIKVCNA